MNLQRLLAEYRKISRRLKRRALVASARQIQAWKRRLAHLEQRIRLMGGRSLRRVALASALAGAALPNVLPAPPLPGPSNSTQVKFSHQDPRVTLLTGQNLSVSGGTYGWAQAAFADIDADGDLDAIASASRSNYLAFFENQGSRQQPKFVDRTQDYGANPLGGQYTHGYYVNYFPSVALGDIDGDFDIDLVAGVSNSNQSLQLFENTGTPQHPVFTDRSYDSTSPFFGLHQNWNLRPTLADFDADGDLDMILAGDGLMVAKNVGTRTQASFQILYGAEDPFDGQYPGGVDFVYVTTGDIDGDGDLDLLLGGYNYNYDTSWQLWRNTGTRLAPKFVYDSLVPGVYNPNGSPTLVDYDGDGDLDVVSGSTYLRGLQNWTNVGTASAPRFSQEFANYYLDAGTVNADIDSDGDEDHLNFNLVSRNDQGKFNQFKDGMTLPYYGGRAFGDVDGDGDNDMVFSSYGSIRYFRKDGAAGQLTFTELLGAANPFDGVSSGGGNTNGRMAHLVDVDGDNDLDLVTVRYDDDHSITFTRNDGTPTQPIFSDQTGTSNDPFASVGNVIYTDLLLDDLDGDGDMDLVTAGYYGPGYGYYGYKGQRRYFRNDTNGPGMPQFQQMVGADDPFAATASIMGITSVSDLDHDGDLDILLWDEYTPTYAFTMLRNDTTRFNKVDAVAVSKGKILLGPVPAKAGEDVCVFVDKNTDSVDVELFNFMSERVQAGLVGVNAANACFKANVAPGLYWARIKSGDRTFVQKIIITAK